MTAGERTVQLLSVFTVVLCAAAIAVPKTADARRRKEAERVVADVQTVRDAAYRFYSDSAYFPAESPDGSIPEPLVSYLPPGFTPARSWGTLQYRNWLLDVPELPKRDTVLSPMPDAPIADTATTLSLTGADTLDVLPRDSSGRILIPEGVDLTPPTQPLPVQQEEAPAGPAAPNVIGLTVVARDPRVAAAAAAIAWETPQFTIGNKFTFVIFGT